MMNQIFTWEMVVVSQFPSINNWLFRVPSICIHINIIYTLPYHRLLLIPTPHHSPTPKKYHLRHLISTREGEELLHFWSLHWHHPRLFQAFDEAVRLHNLHTSEAEIVFFGGKVGFLMNP